MNITIFSGRVTKDADVRTSASGVSVARFTLAVDRVKKEGQEQSADFINCLAFGKTAEAADKYFKKGTKLLLRGHWQTGSYEKDGQKNYTNDNVIDTWEFGESKKDGFTPIPEGFGEELPFAQPTR